MKRPAASLFHGKDDMMTKQPSNNPSTDQPEYTLTDKYHAAMELLYADGEWYRLPRWIFKIQPTFCVAVGEDIEETKTRLKDEAYTFAAALNQSAVRKAVSMSKGWFEFSSSQAEDDTGFSRSRIEDHIKLLVNCRLLKLGKRAKKICGRRRIKVNYSLLVDLIDEYLNAEKTRLREKTATDRLREKATSACGKNPQALAGKNRNLVASIRNKVKKKKGECPQADNPLLKGFDPPEEGDVKTPHREDVRRTEEYRKAVEEKHLLDSKSKMNKWIEAFASLRDRGHSDEEIDETLHGYLPHISFTMTTKKEGRWPQAFSAIVFVEKYTDIRARVLSEKKDNEDAQKDGKRQVYFQEAKQAADDNGCYSVKYDGRLYSKNPQSKAWIQIEPGEESNCDAPDATIFYVRYVRGVLPEGWEDPNRVRPPSNVAVLNPDNDF